MHCLLHLNESLNLEDFLSLSHQQNASVGPFWSFIDRNDRFPTLSHASNNEIQAIFLKPVKGTPFVHSSPPPPVLCSKKQSCTARNTSFEYTLCEDEVETKSSYNNCNTGKQQQKYWLFLETKAILYWFVMNLLEVPLKDKKINILVQVIHWYFQPIIYIRLLSSLEQVTNLGFGK